MSILREIVGAVCCCFPSAIATGTAGISRDLKRLSDWRAHPTLRQYDLEQHIADGGFSEIWLARHRATAEAHCLKVVNLRKPGLKPEDAEVLRGEARFLRNLDHPGLLRCRDVFETKYHMVMVLEYLSGGEVLEHLHKVEHYSEGQAARLFAQVASAVAYMHNLNIVHRDIKPENVMFARPVEECLVQGRPLRVKLIDLGMATVLLPQRGEREDGQRAAREARRRQQGGQQQQQRAPPGGCLGSPGFIAPEVVNGGPHTFAMDVFSLGVLLFVMLTGRKPWALREVRSLAYGRSDIAQAPGLKDASFLSLSASARELLLYMLADDPRVRPTCAAVLRHPFIAQALAAAGTGAAQLQRPLDDTIKRRIAQLASLRRFRGLSFALMASRQEGQQLGDFIEHVAERRKALHRDLVSRAKVRRSVDQQRRQQQQQQSEEEALKEESWQQRQQPAKWSAAADGRGASGGVAGAPGPGVGRRLSADSASSQQPLLLLQQQQQHQRDSLLLSSLGDNPHPRPLDASLPSLDSIASSASSRQPLIAAGDDAPLPSHHHSHHYLPINGYADAGGDDRQQVTKYAGREAAPARLGRQYYHHSNYQPHRHQSLDPVAEPGEGSGADCRASASPPVLAATAARLPLAPRAVAASVAAPAASGAGAPVQQPTNGRSRGWSSSGRGEEPAAEPPRRQQQPKRGGKIQRSKGSELELAALDPLALIRELPGGPGGVLGRAHSAPESSAASLLLLLGGGGGGGGGQVPAGGEALGNVAGGRGGEAGGGAAAWLERLAMGADMRAFSASSWTLDLLENEELLAALTGINIAHRVSSSNADVSVHNSITALYGTGTGSLSAALDATVRGSGDLGPTAAAGGGDPAAATAAAAAAAAVALHRLCSGLSSAGGRTSSAALDATVHAASQAAALLATAAAAGYDSSVARAAAAAAAAALEATPSTGASRRSRGGWPSHDAAHAAALAVLRGGGSTGGRRRPSRLEGDRSDATAAGVTATAAAADTPTRSITILNGPATAASAAGVDTPIVLAGDFSNSWSEWHVGATSPFMTRRQGRGALLHAERGAGDGWAGANRGGGTAGRLSQLSQPRALFTGDHAMDAAAQPHGGAGATAAGGFGAAAGVKSPGFDVGLLRGGHNSGEGPGEMEPLQLVRAARRGASDGLHVGPSCDVSYISLHLSASSRLLGVALPAAAASTAAAAAAVGLVAEPPPRRTSLALVDMDEHIGARWASLEETLHGGNLWFRSAAAASGSWGSPIEATIGATDAAVYVLRGAAAASDPANSAAAVNGEVATRRAVAQVEVEVGVPLEGLRPSGVAAVGQARALRSSPLLERIAEGADVAAAAASAERAETSGRAKRGDSGGGGGGGAIDSLGSSKARPAESRWRSPFEALAAAALADPDPAASPETRGTS